MRRLTATIASAALLLALIAATASGRAGFSASPTTSYLFFDDVELGWGGEFSVRCDMTLGLSLASTIPKRLGTVAGSMSLAIGTGACASGDAGLYAGGVRTTGLVGPRDVKYEAFGGTLPNIGSIDFQVHGIVHLWVDMGEGLICSIRAAAEITLRDGPELSSGDLSMIGPPEEWYCLISIWEWVESAPIYADLAHTERTSVTLGLI